MQLQVAECGVLMLHWAGEDKKNNFISEGYVLPDVLISFYLTS